MSIYTANIHNDGNTPSSTQRKTNSESSKPKSSEGKHLFAIPNIDHLTRKGRSVKEIYKNYYSKGFIAKNEQGEGFVTKQKQNDIKEMIIDALYDESLNKLPYDRFANDKSPNYCDYRLSLARTTPTVTKKIKANIINDSQDNDKVLKAFSHEHEEGFSPNQNNRIPDVIYQEYNLLQRKEALLKSATVDKICKSDKKNMRRYLEAALLERRESSSKETDEKGSSGNLKNSITIFERKHVDRIKSAHLATPINKIKRREISSEVFAPEATLTPFKSLSLTPSRNSPFKKTSLLTTPLKGSSPDKGKHEKQDVPTDLNDVFRDKNLDERPTFFVNRLNARRPSPSLKFPSWLFQRPDFQASINSENYELSHKLIEICKKPYVKRNDEDQSTVKYYLKNIEIFKQTPGTLLTEISLRLNVTTLMQHESVSTNLELKYARIFLIYIGELEVKEDKKVTRNYRNDELVGLSVLEDEKLGKLELRGKAPESFIFYLSNADLEQIFYYHLSKNQDLYVGFLQQLSFFHQMTEKKINDLAKSIFLNFYFKNDVIYTINDPSDHFYIVFGGKCIRKVELEMEKNYKWPTDKGKWKCRKIKKQIVHPIIYSKKNYFGFDELILKKPRDHTVEALEDSLVISIRRDRFFEILDREYLGLMKEYHNKQPPSDVEKVREMIEGEEEAMKTNVSLLKSSFKRNYSNIPINSDIYSIEKILSKNKHWIDRFEKRGKAGRKIFIKSQEMKEEELIDEKFKNDLRKRKPI